MGFDTELFRQEATTQGAATGDSKLAGVPGTGTLQVWRGQNQDVIKILGTWRTSEDSNGLDRLREALEEKRPITYDGVLDDPGQSGKKRVQAQVAVSSIGTYRLNHVEDQAQVFVNFVPVAAREVVGGG